MAMRDSFIFYKSFFDALTDLNDEDRLIVFDAICNLALYGEEAELTGVPSAMFKLMKPQILANNRKYENGKKGGRPNQNKTKQEPNQNQNETKPKPNVNDNVNVLSTNVDNITPLYPPTGEAEEESKEKIPYGDIVDYLNQQTGKNYRSDTAATQRLIRARYNEGFTLEDFKTVIDHKARDWLNDAKYNQYLRPKTLFGTNFESYLQERPKTAVDGSEELDRLIAMYKGG